MFFSNSETLPRKTLKRRADPLNFYPDPLSGSIGTGVSVSVSDPTNVAT